MIFKKKRHKNHVQSYFKTPMFYSGKDIYIGVGKEDKEHVYFEKSSFSGDSVIQPLENHKSTSWGYGRGAMAQPHTQEYNKSIAWHTVCTQ